MTDAKVELVDTTLRDGAQSLWASAMRSDIIAEVGPLLDEAGFLAVEVPMSPTFFKKFVRDLREDPWEMARVIARTMPHAVKATMAGDTMDHFGPLPPREIIQRFYGRLAEIGALNRVQLICNTTDQIRTSFPWLIPFFRSVGLKVVVALAYTLSPRHDDRYYADKARSVLPFQPDAIYLKDPGGLLTPERIRTLYPAVKNAAAGVPVEVHTHCTAGMGDAVYVEALKAGADTVHTGIPPLANGSAQPSVFALLHNLEYLGRRAAVDLERVEAVARRLSAIAQREGWPQGTVHPYDYGQYVHQVPGGVISNLRHQLAELGLQARIPEVLEEAVRVRAELGYPIMITPYSQFVVTQAAINVAVGTRWKVVIDACIRFALGLYGEDSGYTFMDPSVRDKILALPRARELQAEPQRATEPPSVDQLRAQLGGPDLSDEEFLLRYLMKGDKEIQAMRAAQTAPMIRPGPLVRLVETFSAGSGIGYLRLEQKGDRLVLARLWQP
ncbi:MAG: biotin carboxyl carrier protein [Firmicutes bacterium]|nr:biotin carboxyl carrier protein [Alicyclobacillaceae bacterium]MCL6497060.1 biotin carboxyl carrier protein [Bacillota bacterium]